jgi:hypothetical protein
VESYGAAVKTTEPNGYFDEIPEPTENCEDTLKIFE